MSSELLDDIRGSISTWAKENATWTGQFHGNTITLSPIHPLSSISNLTLRLGTSSIALSAPQSSLSLIWGSCDCCFDLSLGNGVVWCRFQGCNQHMLSATTVHTVIGKVAPNPRNHTHIHRLIIFKNEEPFSFQSLSKQVRHVELFHAATQEILMVPDHISVLNIVKADQLSTISGLNENGILEHLSISWCSKLKQLSTIASKQLRSLKIHWCQKLASLPPIESSGLTTLDIQACQSLQDFPNVRDCINLEEVRFCWFSQNISIPSFETCHKLRFLTLRAMNTMIQLPTFSTERLELLDVAESSALQTISVKGMRLRTLIADGCDQLHSVDVTNSPNLKQLSLARVPTLTEIHGLVENHSLQHLQISEAPTLNHLDGLETNFDLRSLTLVNCPELTHLPNWRRLIQMTELTIYGCQNLTTLPEWTLPSLETLKIGGCDAIEHMASFSQFPNLKLLKWTSFNGKETIIDLSSLIHLEQLSITGHPSLQKVKGLDELHQLETVDFGRCNQLKELPGLGTSIRLRQIDFQGCRSLKTLPPLFQLINLEELSLSHCSNLKRLDCLYLHPHLKLLNISHCPSLQRLPLLHPKTRASIRQLYCSHLPQPIDISKVVGGVPNALLREIHVENSNLLSLHPLLNCIELIEITGLNPISRWKLLLKIAIEREDIDWIVEHWSICLQHLDKFESDQMAMVCIEALKLFSTPLMLQQLFSKLRGIEHASTGDSLIPAPVWQQLFEWLFEESTKLFTLFEPILLRQTIKIDLMREENWFPVLIDVVTKRTPSSQNAILLENIYKQALFTNTPMYEHLRQKWVPYLE